MSSEDDRKGINMEIEKQMFGEEMLAGPSFTEMTLIKWTLLGPAIVVQWLNINL